MGLDMYLYRKHYVKQWSHIPDDKQHHVTVKKGGIDDPCIKPERVVYIVEEVGYWRKFNALHNWFVENCQNGEDDCKESYVDVEQLEELLATLKKIDKDHSLAQELLPTSEGFFFGTTEYDEWYFENLENTILLLDSLLDQPCGEYYYKSSW